MNGLKKLLHALEESFEALGFGDHGVNTSLGGLRFGQHALVRRKKNHVDGRSIFLESATGVQAMHARHGKIHDDHVRVQRLSPF